MEVELSESQPNEEHIWESTPMPRKVLPHGLEQMAPGAELGQALAKVDRDSLNGYELIVVLETRARQIASMQAELYADMMALAYCPAGDRNSPPLRAETMDVFAADEVRAALTLTRKAADHHFGLAYQLVERLPGVWHALSRGEIDIAKAKVICHNTFHLDLETARRVADTILPEAAQLTTGQIAARLRTLCVQVDPTDAKQRYQSGLAERRVVAQPNCDGTADLIGCNLPADRAAAILDGINRLALAAHFQGDQRTMDQRRADVYLDLLEGRQILGAPEPRGKIDIRIDLTTLIGLDDSAAEIPGWGPVIADVARQAIERQPDGEWRVAVTDADTGAVLWNGVTRRRPSIKQRRYVETRHPSCVFPGCRMPVSQTDLDHRDPYATGGPTITANLEPLCRHDHRVKHLRGWKLRQTKTGRFRWTSPHGHSYTNTPRAP
jgi:Domain of unknown function (DUF222)/HNH endonuclease